MLTRFLFPHQLKQVGWVLVLVAGSLGLLQYTELFELPPFMRWLPTVFDDYSRFGGSYTSNTPRENTDLYAVLLIVGGLLAACSREQREDEYISLVRLDSLLWALYAYCALLVLAFVLVSGLPFIQVMTYAMFAPLLLFLVRFQLVLRFSSRNLPNEK